MLRLIPLSVLVLTVPQLAAATDTIDPEAALTLPAEEGTAVGFGQAVKLGDLVLTPVELVEESRCPADAQCVTAGKLRIAVRVEGADWSKTFGLDLGGAYGTNGYIIRFAEARPDPVSDGQIDLADYRFSFALSNFYVPAD